MPCLGHAVNQDWLRAACAPKGKGTTMRYDWISEMSFMPLKNIDVRSKRTDEVTYGIEGRFVPYMFHQLLMLPSLSFVVQAVSITSLSPVILSETTSAQKASFPRAEPSVLIGIFPASVCHVRSGNENDTGELSVAYEKAIRAAQQRYRRVDEVSDYDHPALGTGGLSEMDTVKEEDEKDAELVSRPQNLDIERAVVEVGLSEGRPVDVLSRKGSKSSFSRPNRPKSLVLEQKKTVVEKDKDQPPLPRLTAGDSTSGGQQWPLVDEIACAIREWYSVCND